MNSAEAKDNLVKVDAVVILASGVGNRLLPLTFDTPKCMLRAKGEVLIERQIEQIKSAGIKEIFIVVGFLKQKFEYLVEKYNVKLIYNDEYNKKNTLASLHKTIPYLQNKSFYITVADIYLDENVYNKYEENSHFKSVYIDYEHDEWCCETGPNNEILKINRHSGPSYTMVGIAFFTKEKSKILFEKCDELYHKENTEKYYWEEVLYFYLKDFDKFYQQKLKKNIFHEFDTFNELKQFNGNEFDNYGSKTLSTIANAMKVSENDILNIKVLQSGLTNKSFIFNIKNDKKKFLARTPGNGTDEFINRADEKIVLEELKNFDIAEKVLYYDDYGYKISYYYEDAKQLDINNEEELIESIKLLKKLHSYNIIINNKNDIENTIYNYEKIINKHNIIIDDNVKQIIPKIKKLIEIKNSLNRPHKFCHGDFNPTNVLFTKDGIKIIDFEYSMMSDPLTDISAFGGYCNMSIEKILDLYEIYKNADGDNSIYDNIDENNLLKLYLIYIALSSYYGYLWGITNQFLSESDVSSSYTNSQKELLLSSITKIGD